MEKQKNKTKHMPNNRKRFLKIALASFAIFALIFTVLVILGPIQSVQIYQTSLPDELLSTAEYVFESTSVDEVVNRSNEFYLRLILDESLWAHFGNSICIWAGVGENRRQYERNSRLFVNGSQVFGYYSSSYLITFPDVQFVKCVAGDLESGLHLIEFQLRDSFWGAPIATQQWAIEIE